MMNTSWPVAIAYLVGFLLSTYGQLLLTETIMHKQRKVSVKAIYAAFFLLYLVRALNALLLPASALRNILTTVGGFFLVTLLYRASILKRIMASLAGVALGSFAEMITITILGVFLNNSIMYVLTETQITAFGLICSNILVFLLDILGCQIFRVGDMRAEPSKIYTIAVISIPAISILAFLATIGGIVDGQGESLERLAVVFLVSLAVNLIVLFVYRLLVKEANHRYEQMLLWQQSQAYAQELALKQESEQSIRALRHDIQNHITVVRGLIDQGRMDELNEYLSRFSNAVEPSAEYIHTGFTDLDSLLNYKLNKAEKAGARVELDVVVPENFGVEAFDLISILGNLLDNAIEGFAPCEDKRLYIQIRMEWGMLIIKIQNTFDGFVKKSATGKILTRKGSKVGHGIGLSNVERALEKYNGNMTIEHENNLFTVTAMLYPKDDLTKEEQEK